MSSPLEDAVCERFGAHGAVGRLLEQRVQVAGRCRLQVILPQQLLERDAVHQALQAVHLWAAAQALAKHTPVTKGGSEQHAQHIT